MSLAQTPGPDRSGRSGRSGRSDRPDPRRLVLEGGAVLGIELGSTRIKAALAAPDGTLLAGGSHTWENRLVDGVWTYDLDEVWSGLRACYAALVADADARLGVRPTSYAALGVSAMMHGYLALDADDEPLVPFRTWRNTGTGPASAALRDLLGVPVPLRWSVAHLHQAVLDDEPHLPRLARLTTLAGYVHRRLTGRHVLGVGDASGMFPVDAATGDYDRDLLDRLQADLDRRRPAGDVRLAALLPEVLPAGCEAGRLTPDGARLLDPTGRLEAGVALCPPEGDAGTGMVATNAVAPRTGNVSVGTSVFAMVVLERPLAAPHDELDLVTTPAGDPVAMVHANNGADELGAWAALLGELAAALGHPAEPDAVFAALLGAAAHGERDAGGLVSYGFLSGEPVLGLADGRPLLVRAPGARLSLGNLARAHLLGVFGALGIGMRVLAAEGVVLDEVVAHGGLLRTEGAAQPLLAATLGVPVAVRAGAGEGGAWGMALLAAYLHAGGPDAAPLATWLDEQVFAGLERVVVAPDPDDVAGAAAYLDRFEAGLPVQAEAVRLL